MDDGLEDHCGECASGDVECQGNELEVCDASVWKPSESCELACISETAGADHCAEQCVPGVSDCMNGTTRRDCARDGTWASATESCSHACIDNGDQDFCAPACKPGDRRCTNTGAQYQQCNAQGSWPSEASSCLSPTPVCIGDGQCAACDPAAYSAKCNDATLRTCSTTGTLVDTTCPSACVEIGGIADCHDCAPGSKRCQNGNVYTCSAEGSWPSTASEMCGSLGCYGNPPSARCGDCAEGDTTCVETGGVGQKQVCTQGSWGATNSCAPYGCNADADDCASCTNGDTLCSTKNDPGGELSTCKDGAYGAAEPCAAAAGCDTDQSCAMAKGSGGSGNAGAGSGGSAGGGASGGSSP